MSTIVSRRSMLKAAGVTTAALLTGTAFTACGGDGQPAGDGAGGTRIDVDHDRLFAELDAKVEQLMALYAVPGVAIGVWHQGREHLRGFGITDVDAPEPVTPDTLFRIGSTTKTFTGTAVVRLVEAGQVSLDERVRTYVPELTTADPSVAEQVTVRHLLNHTPGWHGDYFLDQGPDDDALTRYVAQIATLPQLTPLGSTFAYNNAAITLAGHVVERITGTTYEQAIHDLVLDPLGLAHTGFALDDLSAHPTAAPHALGEDGPVLNPDAWYMPRSLNPTGGLISNARDQLRYARFHLGDGSSADGTPVLRPESLVAMRSDPGPGGTLAVEIDGMGLTWHLRPTAEGSTVVQHGGAWAGQHSGFYFVPDHDFALTVLTNSDGGALLNAELMYGDWALERFAGLHNMPATPRDLTSAELAAYEGRYHTYEIEVDGSTVPTDTLLTADGGRLRYQALTPDGTPIEPGPHSPAHLAFYRDDHVIQLDRDGGVLPSRSDFVRDEAGEVRWLRTGGRLHRRTSPDPS